MFNKIYDHSHESFQCVALSINTLYIPVYNVMFFLAIHVPTVHLVLYTIM